MLYKNEHGYIGYFRSNSGEVSSILYDFECKIKEATPLSVIKYKSNYVETPNGSSESYIIVDGCFVKFEMVDYTCKIQTINKIATEHLDMLSNLCKNHDQRSLLLEFHSTNKQYENVIATLDDEMTRRDTYLSNKESEYLKIGEHVGIINS